jgi:hypothetical protein
LKKVYVDFDNDLRNFANTLTSAINFNKDGSDQKEQVELLMGLETKFLNSVWKYQKQMREIIKKFILMVVVENRNILTARPYFREKSVFFNSHISPAIKNVKLDAFKGFHVNFLMMMFIKENWKGNFPDKSEGFYRRAEQARKILIENNLPMAVNKARQHFRNVSQSHLSLMDIIGTASSGLIDGIDKYVGEYSKVFIGVCIGRMTGDMIDESSETSIHFYPSDKHVIYRANTLKKRYKIQDIHTLTRAVNKSFEMDKKEGRKAIKSSVTVAELERLMLASSMLSLEASYADPDSESDSDSDMTLSIGDSMLDTEDDLSIEDEVSDKEAWTKVYEHLSDITILERKILRMKGIKI